MSQSTKPSHPNNEWHTYNDLAETVIVFVHGYFSDSAKCWQRNKGPFWPDLLLTEERLDQTSIFLGGYTTNFYSTSYSVGDCAIELQSALTRVDSNGRRAPISFDNIIFVCHSLGGIVVRELLASYPKDFHDKKIGLLLLASPSLGSDYATSLGGVITFYGNRLGKQLSFGNAYLEDLDRRFNLFLAERSPTDFLGGEAVELYAPSVLRYLPGFKPIVSGISAGRYFPLRMKLPEDHSGIAKPTDASHRTHELLVRLVNGLIPRGDTPHSATITPLPTPSNASLALFDTYSAPAERYYLIRRADEVLTRAFRVHSVWMAGTSGTGKTCMIKRAVRQHGAALDICLSQLTTHATRAEIALELLATLEQRGLSQAYDPSADYFSPLSDALNRAFECGLTVSIDEVPSGPSSDTAETLLGLLTDLLVALNQRSLTHPVRFVVSSLYPPRLDAVRSHAKAYEQFSFLDSPPWTVEELGQLSIIIRRALPEIVISENNESSLIEGARGLPRVVKIYYRALWSRPDQAPNHFKLLDAAKAQGGAS